MDFGRYSSLEGKRALIVGVANERSLAWAITRALHATGCSVGLTFLNEALERRVRPLAESVSAELIEPCDVQNPETLDALVKTVEKKWGSLDYLVHSIAYAEKQDLAGRFIETSREGFQKAMDVSVYSLIDLTKRFEPLMHEGSSILTLSYIGAQRVIPNYNLMGVAKAALESTVRYLSYDLGVQKIRVNAISAGPVKTLAAAGIRDLRQMLQAAGDATPLKENIDADDVGALGAFLLSDNARHITGGVHYVDSGAHIL